MLTSHNQMPSKIRACDEMPEIRGLAAAGKSRSVKLLAPWSRIGHSAE
jgi:hypothetical protein